MSDAPERPPILKLTRLPAAQEAKLHEGYRVIDWSDGEPLPAEAGAIRAVVSSGIAGLPRTLAEGLPALGLVALSGVGLDAVDLAWTRANGVRVTTTRGALEADVADLAIGLWLAVSRRLVSGDRFVREGRWEAGDKFPLAWSVSRRRVGVLGMGAIGREIGRRAEAFGGEVRYTTRRPVDAVPWRHVPSLIDLADWADVLFVIIPGGAATAGLVNAEVLAALGPRGVLVNVARGEVVDEAALVAALEAGRLGGAGLDVFVDEPRTPHALWERDDVVLAPHVGSATEEARGAMAEVVLENLEAFFAGRPGPFRGEV